YRRGVCLPRRGPALGWAMTRALVSATVAGVVFALGLALGGMTLPSRVIAFLDVTGDWDPSLALVMLGAVAVYAPGYRWLLRRRSAPLHAPRYQIPETRTLDLRLVAGSALFGLGWGLAGYCPGPGLVSAGALGMDGLTF